MLIQGSFNTQRDNILLKKYIDLIKAGTKSDEILVLLLNPYKKANFIQSVKNEIRDFDEKNSRIYTIYGLCYNSFYDNENYIKKLIRADGSRPLNMCGLEVSQYIFKQSIKEADFSDYISKVNLLHQLFRRYSLIVQNDLSNEEVEKRSKILKESFYKDAQKAINNYKLKTIEYQSFDYLRQLATLHLIYKNTDYFNKLKYLFVFDADELSYSIWQFIYNIIPDLKDYFIGYDKDGSSRCGYLCAYKTGVIGLKEKFHPEETVLSDESRFYNMAQALYNNIKLGKKTDLNETEQHNYIRRLDMADKVSDDIYSLIGCGVKPNDIAIITPVCDEFLIEALKDNRYGIMFQLISGNLKLADDKTIKQILTVLKTVNSIPCEEYEIKSIFIDLLKIPYRKCIEVIKKNKKFEISNRVNFDDNTYNSKYTKFLSVINSLTTAKYSLSEQIKIIYSNLFGFAKDENTTKKYMFLLKEAESFENAFKAQDKDIASEFILQIENSIISENPIDSFSLKENCVIIASPQKIIDYNLKTSIQFWLDISSGEWFKQDTGTLYNSWVFNRDWDKKEYTLEDNIELTRDKTARMVRKLILCAEKEIKLYSSIYDNNGSENFMGLSEYIESGKGNKTEFKIVPRDDQKPVLEYKKGKMGIMAVPGAGKTTILLALIIKLINDGINAGNIFVLTYMESAARNFKERIKQAVSSSSELPNISTIHGLALRIIKENGNWVKAGLDENFEICDDTIKERIIKEIFFRLKIDEDKYDNYLKCISTVKLGINNGELKSKYKEIQEFYDFLNEYNIYLKQKNLIDYDDMLRYALMILETDKETREYYQNICKYIIEDEAQDSSEIQQKLINILAEKHKNIVRCGDINQSITSTFTNSDLESFKKFINENKKVEMHSSQRCSRPIYEFANKMLNRVKADETTKNAFYQIKITGTNKNPDDTKEPEFLIFERETDEKRYITDKIKEIKKEKPDSSIAVLLRNNIQVNEYNEFLNINDIKTSIRSDCLNQKKIYKFIYAVLNFLENPFNNETIINLAELYSNKYHTLVKEEALKFLKSLKESFILLKADDFNNELLLQLYWDTDFWLNCSTKSTEDIALKAGLYYSSNSSDKSNTYLVSTLIKHIKNGNLTSEDVLKTLQYNAQRPLSAYRFFDEETEKDTNYVNIMTMHKSKGDEFDYVFIPQLYEDNYSINKGTIKLKSGGHFVQTIKNAVENCGIKSPDSLKQDQIEETLRLLYVGITRAKHELYLTCAKNYRIKKNVKPCELFKDLCGSKEKN